MFRVLLAAATAFCAVAFFQLRPVSAGVADTAEVMAADVDDNGMVNATDVALVRHQLTPAADVNQDGTMNSTDLEIVVSHYGEVVEPSTMPAERRPQRTPAPPWTATPAGNSSPVVTLSLMGSLTGNYSVRAITTVPGDIQVRWEVDGEQFSVENSPPYYLFGDSGGSPNLEGLGTGEHEIRASVHPESGGPAMAVSSMLTLAEGPPTPSPSPTATSTAPATATPTRTATPTATSTPAGPSEPVVTLNLTGSLSGNYSVRAITTAPGDIQIRWEVDGEAFSVENSPPYYLFGDNGNLPNLDGLGAGAHEIRAWVLPQAGGLPLTASSMLTIVEGVPTATPPPSPTATYTSIAAPSATPVAPTPTRTPNPPTPTRTPVAPTPTFTLVPATATPTRTPTPTRTATATPTRTATPTASATFVAAPSSTPLPGATRDKLRQPFSSTSPWNMPIGSSAVYVPINLPSTFISVDEEPIILSPSSPLRTLFENGDWPASCDTSSASSEGQVPVPDGYIVPQPDGGFLPNYSGGVLKSDGRTIVELQYATRCSGTGPLTAGIVRGSHDIYGSGIGNWIGGHGGSSLSGVGGSLRVWEVESDAPIQHALKVNLTVMHLSNALGGYRWPARNADSGYDDPGSWAYYAGSTPALRMGALLALPPGVNVGGLGLETSMGLRIAKAMQDYGAYVVDANPNTWDPHTIDIEYGVQEAMEDRFGYAMDSGAMERDLLRLFTRLQVVDNNGPSSIGGGGTPRVPLAPPIGN